MLGVDVRIEETEVKEMKEVADLMQRSNIQIKMLQLFKKN